MIKSNEVRIGNYMVDKSTGAYLIVIVIEYFEENKITTYVIDRSKFPLPDGWQMQPIPLTPEILQKAGLEKFCKYGQQQHFFKNHVEIIHDEFGECFLYKRSLTTYTEIKYLHQLQNLYFALTGKELEIKL